MKPEIIPAILTKSRRDFVRRLALAARLAPTVQIDVMDGLFVDNKTPRDLNNGRWFGEFLVDPPDRVPDIELHLMVLDPWTVIREWHEYAELKRVIWHVESPIDHSELMEIVHGLGLEAGLAINPGTPIKEIIPFINPSRKKSSEFVDEILVMGVKPGFSGQKFIPSCLKTITALRHKFPKLDIGVDGHVSYETSSQIIKAGANRLNAANALFLAKDPEWTYLELQHLI